MSRERTVPPVETPSDKRRTLPAFVIDRFDTQVECAVNDARAVFERDRALLVRSGLSEEMLDALDRIGRHSVFVDQPVPHIGHRRVDSRELVATALKIAICRPAFLRWVEAVTGCGPVRDMAAWVAETRPGGAEHLGWHRDTGADYALGVTVHLGRERYDGGAFELRETATGTVRFRHDRAQRGDVLLFDIDQKLEHRVTPIASGAARRVFTGWLLKAPSDRAAPVSD
ncbi:2OG-Fe(II) oxygenase [Sphingomonas sp.]|uniref:2OG-Fe(II) oxygenase n=1 Tax=Sphingomonas sp. TaxID=28214 RepID=UPI00307F1745